VLGTKDATQCLSARIRAQQTDSSATEFRGGAKAAQRAELAQSPSIFICRLGTAITGSTDRCQFKSNLEAHSPTASQRTPFSRVDVSFDDGSIATTDWTGSVIERVDELATNRIKHRHG
jgi:hypothetical protein